MPSYTMPDGNPYEFENDEVATKAYQVWGQQYGGSSEPKGPAVPPTTPSQEQGVANFMGGASSTSKGAYNLVARLFGKELADTESFSGVPIDKSSGLYSAGNVFDPTAAGISALGTRGAAGIKYLAKTPVGQGLVGGTASGAVIGALSPDGDPLINAMQGGVVGGGVGTAVPLVAKGVAMGLNKAQGITSTDVRTGRVLRDLSEGATVSPDPSLTTAQATNRPAPGLASLDQEMRGATGAEGYLKNVAQKTGRKSALATFAGGETQEEIMRSVEASRKALAGDLDPLRKEGAEAANTNTNFFTALSKEAARQRAIAEKAVNNVRIAERGHKGGKMAFINRKGFIANPPGKYTYLGELGDRMGDSEAAKSLAAGAEARALEARMEHTSAHGLQALNTAPIITEINTLLNKVGERTNDTRKKALTGLKAKIEEFSKDGTIDAYDLHEIRKGSNDLIDTLFNGQDQPVKQRAATAIGEVKGTIDKAFENAGGDALTKYFDLYSKGMERIRQQELVGKIMAMSEKDQKLIALGEKPDKIKKVLGLDRYSVDDIGAAAEVLRKNAKELLKNQEVKESSKYGARLLERSLSEHIPNVPRANVLNREAQIANTAVAAILKGMDKDTLEALGRAVNNPIEAIRLMGSIPNEEKQVVLRWLRNPYAVGGISGMMSGGATQ